MDNKSLDALFSGLTEAAAPASPQKEATAPQLEKSNRKGDSAIPYRAKQRQQEQKRHEERLCTIVNSELVKKIRILASIEGLTIRNVVEAAFQKAISSYELKHGELPAEHKKNLKDLF